MRIIKQEIPNSNYAKGRTQRVRKIIVHWIVGTLESADNRFKTPGAEVSAHYGIEDATIYQWVAQSDTAYHAISANPFSIGIEHSSAPGRPASERTYQTTIELCTEICRTFRLDPDLDIEPHSKYVATKCPGTLDIARIKRGVKAKLAEGEIEMINKFQLDRLYQLYLGRTADASAIKTYVGKATYEKVTSDIKNSAEFKGLIAAAKAGTLDPVKFLPDTLRAAYKPKPVAPTPVPPTNGEAEAKIEKIKKIVES